jgi:putative toxin-antitoxin system antitoxin component (TIGR02293 family)
MATQKSGPLTKKMKSPPETKRVSEHSRVIKRLLRKQLDEFRKVTIVYLPRAKRGRSISKDLSSSKDLVYNIIRGTPAVRLGSSVEWLTRRGYSKEEISRLVVPMRTLARRQARGEPLTTEETDKALRLERVAKKAETIFGDKEKAHRWLRKPKRTLDGETPLAYLATEAGARFVEEMLNRIDSGNLA